MPKSMDKRTAGLIEECVNLAGGLGRWRDAADEDERDRLIKEYRESLQAKPMQQVEKERRELEIQRRQRFTATADLLLRSSGPQVVTAALPESGVIVMMKRVDLMDLAMSGAGGIPEPLTSRVVEMIEAGDVTEEMMSPRDAAESLMTMRAIACAVCLQPPAEFFENPDIDVDDLDVSGCAKLFSMPGAATVPGQLPVFVPEREQRADGWRGLKREDLKKITRVTIDQGAGAMLHFRLRQERIVANALAVSDPVSAPKRNARRDVPVGSDRPRQGRGAVRKVGRAADGRG